MTAVGSHETEFNDDEAKASFSAVLWCGAESLTPRRICRSTRLSASCTDSLRPFCLTVKVCQLFLFPKNHQPWYVFLSRSRFLSVLWPCSYTACLLVVYVVVVLFRLLSVHSPPPAPSPPLKIFPVNFSQSACVPVAVNFVCWNAHYPYLSLLNLV